MWLMYHWLCGSRKSALPPHHHPSSPPLFHKHASAHAPRKEQESGSRGREEREGEVKGGGACRFMIIPKQMLVLKTLWIANRAACQESRNQNTSLLGGSRWKKGRCEMRFMLSCFCIHASCMDPFLPHTILYQQWRWQPRLEGRYDLNHLRRLKLASVTVGVTAGKNLSDSAWSHRSHYLFHRPLKSFVFCFVFFTQIIFFLWTKAARKPPPLLAIK